MTIKGTAGNDTLTGTAGNDVFNLTQGGEDNASGLGGDDQFLFGATFDAGDTVDGGDGNDTVKLDGDYSAGLTLGATTLTSVERLLFTGGNDYSITTNDANVAAGDTLTVDFGHMHTGDVVTFDGSAESDGNFSFLAGNGHYTITGGAETNTYNFAANFNQQDKIGGPAGSFNNLILNGDYAGLVFQHTSLSGLQQISLLGGHSYNIQFAATTAGNIGASEFFVDGHRLVASDNLSFYSMQLTQAVNVSGGDGADSLIGGGNGSQFSGGDGNDNINAFGTGDLIFGGAGDDTIRASAGSEIHAGSGNDTITIELSTSTYIDGGSGTNTVDDFASSPTPVVLGANSLLHIQHLVLEESANFTSLTTVNDNVAAGTTLEVSMQSVGGVFDGSAETDGQFLFDNTAGEATLTGGALADTFDYFHVAGMGAEFDTIGAFDFSNDIIEDKTVTTIDTAITTGTLNARGFAQGLRDDLGTALSAHGAILFTPDAGDYAGQTFLVVDVNGVAGYQTAADLVLRLTDPLHIDQISTANFISG